MEWKIITFESNRGEKIVDEFIKSQKPEVKAKIAHSVRLLIAYGNKLGLPHSKSLGNGLYELRIRGKDEIRIIYCFVSQRTIYLLHSFKKQTQKLPTKELEIAKQRMKGLTNI